MAKKIARPRLDDMQLSTGKKTRLHRLLYQYGPANGTLLFLPIDQGLEHGPRDFFDCEDSVDPNYQLRIAKESRYSGIVFHIGLAEKYMNAFAGQVPLVLKLNGKTEIPSDKQAFSPQTASVEDAVRLGADAVGYTLYVGSPAQDRDFVQLAQIRQDADRFGMPLIVWSYPRGEAIDAKGGRDSVYAIDYAARTAHELGADVIKLNVPTIDAEKSKGCPKPYDTTAYTEAEALAKVVKSGGTSLVIFAGGSKRGDQDLLDKTRVIMEAGATGLIFGRNIWQRPMDKALEMSKKITDILMQYGQ